MDIATLQAAHGIDGRVRFARRVDGAGVVEVSAMKGHATIALKGAHVLSFTPFGHMDVLWMSPATEVAGPAPIRGGIPVCWPWFAAHPSDPAAPAHGFARTAIWRIDKTAVLNTGDVVLLFAFATRPEDQRWFPGSAVAHLTVRVGSELSLTLETINTGTKPFALTQALHSYFRIGDIARATVDGLDGTDYLDKVEAFARKRQLGPVMIDREVDRIYLGTTTRSTIVDTTLGRRIIVAKQGSASTVVWNPWAERAVRMGDLGDEGWRQFLCVETTNAGDDVVQLAAGAKHQLTASISVAALVGGS